MKRGPKPTPTRMRVLKGDPSHRPQSNPAEPVVEPSLPRCPGHLVGEARAEWRRMGKKLLALGLMTEIDKAALALYCQSWARWVEAERELANKGTIVTSPNGYPQQSPYLAIANRAMQDMRKILVEFGMTPSSRTRVASSTSDDSGPTSIAELLAAAVQQ